MKRNVLLILAGLLLGAGLGIVVLFGLQAGGIFPARGGEEFYGASVHSPQVGAPAPDFELENLDGEHIRLSDLIGKPVLINFWATWCGPCVVEMPDIQNYYQKFGGRFEVLAVNADEPRGDVEKFAKDLGLTFPILLDPGSHVNNLYRLRGYPTTFIVDSEGLVQIQHIGSLSESQLIGYLAKVGLTQ